ncbi:hypothetical protein OG874_43290 [Nocardia sp. NBC_00565]|uniref:hypothetical protein n=1 Tax=Nocardia sp. NBC_00565 TaxID=2975993 RepID=UPI002E81A443|nr:hypothetical protein [Nocardia sp. NBC_00565]WUC03406.1 hypothetical protein OG874_43290 [Nocardia sp. NBC_00565]
MDPGTSWPRRDIHEPGSHRAPRGMSVAMNFRSAGRQRVEQLRTFRVLRRKGLTLTLRQGWSLVT